MNQHSSSFGLFEAFRVAVPGFYFAALLMALTTIVIGIFGLRIAVDGLQLLLGFTAVSLISGLTLYAKEGTKRRKAFQENQPSQYLKTKARAMSDLPVLEESDARQLYFYILNNHVPVIFHEKIFYFGTIYHIMIQIRRTSLWFAVLSSLVVLTLTVTGYTLAELMPLLSLAVLIWLIYALNVRFNKADRKMQENYRDQIYWLEMNNDLVESTLRRRYGPTRG